MDEFIKYLTSTIPFLEKETLDIIEKSFIRKEKKKGDLLFRQGEVCKSLNFISEGMCRSFSIKDGKDITTWFSFKNEFITSFVSFFSKEPSYESVEMLSDGVLYEISAHKFFNTRKPTAQIEQVINYFNVLYTVQLEKRLFLIQAHTAREKYKQILVQQPHLIKCISNKHLASYLGITRETLSRIRSSIN